MHSDLSRLTWFWLIGLIASGYAPYDRPTWFLEVLPALIALPILWSTRERFRFSSLAYALITIHGLILMLGAAYTYSRVPMGNWVKDWFELSRNPYDKLGHFVQGFIPGIVARELLIRFFNQRRGRLLDFLVVCICLAISAVYELLEWAAALLLGQGADEFMGMQGDPFDTQSDMFLALLGALAAVWVFAAWHDRSMKKLSYGG